jgi:PAS domain S-box-containing protein
MTNQLDRSKGQRSTQSPLPRSPIELFILIAFSALLAEAVIMYIPICIPSLSMPYWVWALVDSLLVVLVITPILFFFGYRPLVREIQERKQYENALRVSKEFIQRIADEASLLIAYVDTNEIYQFANRQYESWFGMPVSEIIGKSVREVVGEINYSMVKEKIREVLSGKIVFYEDKLILKDNSVISYEARYIPDFAVDFSIRGYFITAQDITYRKITEEALEHMSHFHNLILNAAGQGIFGLDLEGKVTFINQAGAHMLGYEPEELIGEVHHNKVHYKKQDGSLYLKEHCIISSSFEKGISYSGNNETFWKKDGTPISVELLSTPLFEKNQLLGAVITFDDVTDKKTILKEIEEKFCALENLYTQQVMIKEDLQTSELRSKAQFKGIPVPTYTWQNIDRDFVLIDYNYAAEEYTQGKVSEWKGAKLSEMYRDMPEVLSDMRECFNKKTIMKKEMLYKFRSFDRQAFFIVHYSYVPPDLVLVHAEDITDRKRAEQQLIDSLHEKEVLLQEVHHRVKNNMQVISSLLRLQSMSVKTKRLKDILKDSQSKIRAMALIHEKLYQSRDLTKIRMPDYIDSLIKEISEAYDTESSQVVIRQSIEDISLKVDLVIPCGLIINELITNALKYAFPDGKKGEITIDLKRKDTDTGQIELAVSDSGIGIPEEVDLKSSETLGVHLVTMLAEDQLGGTVTIGRKDGTTFILTFPEKGK